eukprot:g21229.t1
MHTFLKKGTNPPNLEKTWRRWEQLARTLDIRSGTGEVARLWSLRQAETMQTLTPNQVEDLKEAENTIVRARDQLNRTQKRLQTDARLRAMPDRITQNKEWDEDRCLMYRKARQAKPRLHPSLQDTTTHYAELFRARINTPGEAHHLLESALGPQARILTPDAPDQHSRRDIFLGALDNPTPQEDQPLQHPIPSPDRESYALSTTEYTEQDLTRAWGEDLRQSWEQHLLTRSQPTWITDIIEYLTQQIQETGALSRTIHNLTYHHRWKCHFA